MDLVPHGRRGSTILNSSRLALELLSSGLTRHLGDQHVKRSFARRNLCHCATLLA